MPLHKMAFHEYSVTNPLEVSSKSEDPVGVALSSFNLTFTTKLGRHLTVEAAFQGSKVFELGGPFIDIFNKSPIDAKRDERLRSSGSASRAGAEHDAHSIEGGGDRPATAGRMMTIRRIFFPIFNWGQATLIALLIVLLAATAIFGDSLLALCMGVGAYAGIVINSVVRGLAPDEAEISEAEIGPISSMLASERFVHPIGDRVWAPAASRSWLFKSDWISIDEREGKKFVLRARQRDLKLILAEIRPKAAD